MPQTEAENTHSSTNGANHNGVTKSRCRIQFETEEENGHSTEAPTKLRFYLLSQRDDGSVFDFIARVIDKTPEFEDFILTSDVATADLVFLHAAATEWAIEHITKIRAERQHFLKPILLSCEYDFDKDASLVDTIVRWPPSESALAEAIRSISAVAQKVSSFDRLPETLGETGEKKIQLLRYLHSRDSVTLQPQRNFQSSVGYSFPLARILFDVTDGQEVALLENIEEAQLLTSKLIDKINVCPYCNHAQINFREVCPSCRSLKIAEESTIHHFRCAYVGRQSDFQHGFKFSCPKCSRELRHIGVDYDKPSDVLWCSDCNHNFAEPLLSCFCLVCAKTYAPEDVFIKEINEYALSQDGYRAAEEGILPGFGLLNILKKELGFYKYEVFVEYLRIESFRCRRYKYHSTLVRLSLKTSQDALAENEISHSRKLKNDLAALLRETFRTTDLLTDLQDGEILIILTNTDYENSKIALKRLSDGMQALLKKEIVLNYDLIELTEQSEQLNEILERSR